MRSMRAVIMMMLLALGAGCAQEAGRQAAAEVELAPVEEASVAPAQTAATAKLPEQVQRAVTVAKAIEANPDDAEAILKKHGLTQEDLDKLMYEIAADKELSRLYTAAMAK